METWTVVIFESEILSGFTVDKYPTLCTAFWPKAAETRHVQD